MEKTAQAGKIYQGDNYIIVKKMMRKGESIPKHNHTHHDVIFTVISGKVAVNFDDKPFAMVEAGEIIRFDGQHFIDAEILEDAQIQVALIKHPCC
ncbi:cupin domain-containing protein [Suttonella ornithocola]|uniref:Cupin domain n=1 Tax=Suttonella ornithocola TaxID=279832 RepID=A0A380MMR6_9GAMM|nr:cupin domain-containing protein [Suttonella ornithocola]SUO93193.1 Cupin domain [Suttonella ornithocola]